MRKTRVLGLDPGHGGFGFVVMEGPKTLVDWGIRTCRSKDSDCVARKAQALLIQYSADIVLIEGSKGPQRKERYRNRKFQKAIRSLSARLNLRTTAVSSSKIRALFSPYGNTKLERALAVIHKLPQLSDWFPRRRRPGAGEDYRMQVIDAAGLALTFYASVDS
jgi:hypothetical protein